MSGLLKIFKPKTEKEVRNLLVMKPSSRNYIFYSKILKKKFFQE